MKTENTISTPQQNHTGELPEKSQRWEDEFFELYSENRKNLSPMWAIRFINKLLK